MSTQFNLDEHTKKMNDLFKDGKTLEDISKKNKEVEYEDLPCYACQGGGCPVCNGFGTISQPKKSGNKI